MVFHERTTRAKENDSTNNYQLSSFQRIHRHNAHNQRTPNNPWTASSHTSSHPLCVLMGGNEREKNRLLKTRESQYIHRARIDPAAAPMP